MLQVIAIACGHAELIYIASDPLSATMVSGAGVYHGTRPERIMEYDRACFIPPGIFLGFVFLVIMPSSKLSNRWRLAFAGEHRSRWMAFRWDYYRIGTFL
jgi:hypothetical protein